MARLVDAFAILFVLMLAIEPTAFAADLRCPANFAKPDDVPQTGALRGYVAWYEQNAGCAFVRRQSSGATDVRVSKSAAKGVSSSEVIGPGALILALTKGMQIYAGDSVVVFGDARVEIMSNEQQNWVIRADSSPYPVPPDTTSTTFLKELVSGRVFRSIFSQAPTTPAKGQSRSAVQDCRRVVSAVGLLAAVPLLTPASQIVAAMPAAAVVAWRGGRSPYLVRVFADDRMQSEQLVCGTTVASLSLGPETVAGVNRRVTVSDSDGHSVTWDLTVVAVASIRDLVHGGIGDEDANPVAAAIWLLQQPDARYRLEAFRQLEALSDDNFFAWRLAAAVKQGESFE